MHLTAFIKQCIYSNKCVVLEVYHDYVTWSMVTSVSLTCHLCQTVKTTTSLSTTQAVVSIRSHSLIYHLKQGESDDGYHSCTFVCVQTSGLITLLPEKVTCEFIYIRPCICSWSAVISMSRIHSYRSSLQG